METITSITDRPITNIDENLLGVENYAEALSEFILKGATPLTIGMQGQWGSGKTSLMHLVNEILEKDNVATSWVNTWEYSMFRTTEETTPAILSGLLENLKQSVEEKGKVAQKQFWPEENDKKLRNVKKYLWTAGEVGISTLLKFSAGLNWSDIKKQIPENQEKKVATIAEVAEMKQEIQNIIASLIGDKNNPYQKVVFFVDDLDRLEPRVAVSILESLKNMFDVDNCIFILAIDYDVVVKGLEGKFGRKTNENEREFRSFFDKIIQVPFSMPMGVYKIENLLARHFDRIGFEPSDGLKETFNEIVKQTVGYNPRSIKRYINTFSLVTRDI